MSDDKKKEKNLAGFWSDFLREEFLKETDRAAVILTASLFENALTNILKKYFIPIASGHDHLLDGTSAPLSSFSAKIDICLRLSLISSKLAHDLHIVRRMRNEFAHNVHGSNLETGKIKDLLTNLTMASNILRGHEKVRHIYPPGARGEFLMTSCIILFHLQSLVESRLMVEPLKPAEEEWIYSFAYQEPSPPKAAIEAPKTD